MTSSAVSSILGSALLLLAMPAAWARPTSEVSAELAGRKFDIHVKTTFDADQSLDSIIAVLEDTPLLGKILDGIQSAKREPISETSFSKDYKVQTHARKYGLTFSMALSCRSIRANSSFRETCSLDPGASNGNIRKAFLEYAYTYACAPTEANPARITCDYTVQGHTRHFKLLFVTAFNGNELAINTTVAHLKANGLLIEYIIAPGARADESERDAAARLDDARSGFRDSIFGRSVEAFEKGAREGYAADERGWEGALYATRFIDGPDAGQQEFQFVESDRQRQRKLRKDFGSKRSTD